MLRIRSHPLTFSLKPKGEDPGLQPAKIGVGKISFVFAKKWGATPALNDQAGGVVKFDTPSINRGLQPC
jgi:hypothetical protein